MLLVCFFLGPIFTRWVLCYTLLLPRIKEIIKSTINMKNNTLAMLAAPAAIPPNPKTPAIIANIIKVTVQRNIVICFKVNNLVDALSTSFIQRCLLLEVWLAVIRLDVNPFAFLIKNSSDRGVLKNVEGIPNKKRKL